jgi:fructose-bisphosphate aldolase class II
MSPLFSRGPCDSTQMHVWDQHLLTFQVYRVYEALSKIGPMFSIAAAFGNVHGVYKPGNVTLSPHLLGNHQKFIKEKIGSDRDKPAFLVMHGGSGSTDAEIGEAVANGVIKMNIDTDTQWAYWEGLKNFYEDKKEYLQAQVMCFGILQ